MMEDLERKDHKNEPVKAVETFSVPFSFGDIKKSIIINTGLLNKPNQEQIINQALKLHSQGNILEAAKYYQYFIDEGFVDPRVFSNYGVILKNS